MKGEQLKLLGAEGLSRLEENKHILVTPNCLQILCLLANKIF